MTNGVGIMGIQLRQEWSKEGRNVATLCPKKGNDRLCICMVKKIKKKIKNTEQKVSICHFGLLVLVYNNNDCQILEIKSVM